MFDIFNENSTLSYAFKFAKFSWYLMLEFASECPMFSRKIRNCEFCIQKLNIFILIRHWKLIQKSTYFSWSFDTVWYLLEVLWKSTLICFKKIGNFQENSTLSYSSKFLKFSWIFGRKICFQMLDIFH